MRSRAMWCDDFDCDLPKVIPAAGRLFERIGDHRLFTHCSTSSGTINCPTAWNTDVGLASFFGLREGAATKPDGYWTHAPVVGCTVWEAIRDLWAHHQVMIVLRRDGSQRVCWKPAHTSFVTILGDVRGWRRDPEGRAKAGREALRGLARAAAVLEQELGAADA